MKEKIKADRKKRGLTQTEYGNLFCVDKGSVQNWESGRRTPHDMFFMLMSFTTELLQLAHKKSKRIDDEG